MAVPRPGQLARALAGDPADPGPRRYGHDSVTEHQAEAIAFAVHFLQATSRGPTGGRDRAARAVRAAGPGHRLMTRYLALQPIYARHPLRRMLTTGS